MRRGANKALDFCNSCGFYYWQGRQLHDVRVRRVLENAGEVIEFRHVGESATAQGYVPQLHN